MVLISRNLAPSLEALSHPPVYSVVYIDRETESESDVSIDMCIYNIHKETDRERERV